jgi:transposase
VNLQQRRDLLRALVGQIREGEFPYEAREAEPVDWGAYTRAQVREVNDVLLLIRDAVDAAWERMPADVKARKGPGRPPTPIPDLAKALLMQQYFGTANRQTEGLVLLFKEKVGLRRAFSHKTVERAYGREDVRAVLNEVFDLTVEVVADVETGLAVDGSGLPTSMKVNYEAQKGKGNGGAGKRAAWEHAVTTIGTDTKVLTAVAVLGRPEDSECPVLPDLLPAAGAFPSLDAVSADGLFLSRDNVDAIASLGAKPRILPKRNVSFKRKGSDAWFHMLWELLEDPQAWLREYHPRSLAETGYSTFKRDFPKPLRRRLKRRRDTEALVRFCDYNLKRLCYLRYLTDLAIPFSSEP